MGALLCLISAAGFGCMAIFGKEAYAAHVSTLTLLLVRFTLAGAIFAVVIAARPSLRATRLSRRDVATGFGLGAVGYATQAGLFFAALHRMDASLLELLLYTYPAWVTVAAVALGRERATRARLGALALSSAGLVLVLAFAARGHFDTLGAVMAFGAALAYTTYILVADAGAAQIPRLALSALVCAGAVTTFAVVGVASGSIDLTFPARGWMWLALTALVSTVIAIATFFAGLERVGPSAASILSTFEPVVTIVLAYLAFAEHLSAPQLLGAVLVLGAAVMLAARSRTPEVAPPT